MQVNLNPQNNVQPQFGMTVKATPELMDSLGKKFKKVSDWVEFDQFVTREDNNDVAHVLLSLDDKSKKIVAQVGPRKFVEGLLGGPLKPIRKAVASAEDIRARHDAVKLEADADFESTIRSRVWTLPSQKLASNGEEDDVVRIVGGDNKIPNPVMDVDA